MSRDSHLDCRAAGREALGPETSIDDAITYNQFAWFAWERISDVENEITATASLEDDPKSATDVPRLVLLPPTLQRKGMFYTSGNLQLLMLVVRAAENGTDKADLLQQIAEEAPKLNLSSRQLVLSQAGSLNLLSSEGGTYRPTSSGRALLEGESAADVLTPIFVRTVFGFALILRDLKGAGFLTRGEIASKAQSYYPRWTTPFAPNGLVAWSHALGLVTVKGSGRAAEVELTEVGEYWASGLPSELAIPILPPDEPDEPDDLPEAGVLVSTSAPLLFEEAPIDAVLARFNASPELNQFVFSDKQVRLVHAALHSAATKRFILLAGLSGTGKTSMARAYARAYCDVKNLSLAEHYQQISVWPDWTDPSGLLGFINPLADPPTFHETPALQLLLKAHSNQSKPYFLCLDEMNLARVEHYFAPFLSAMEGGATLSIHAGNMAVDTIPNSIPWPRNLFIIGTVNMDETTYPFSDKVLDRAFTFEFWDVDLIAWQKKAAERASVDVLTHVTRVIKALYGALSPARRHFGYRTCDELLGFCTADAGVPLEVALDAA
ncbi:MAG: ATP-binding protein, partial [Verrucomicrobia bacterium]|nr:ATP-binding protein [Verrucomicrobiota bacterium]